MAKSCWTCQNLSTWDTPGTRFEPPDSGYQCIMDLDDSPEMEQFYELPEAEAVQEIAKHCGQYTEEQETP